MIVWRITRKRHRGLDGEGARLNGGRWNAEGVAVGYTSTTLALAALEYLAHVDPEDVPADLVAVRISIPDDLRQERVQASDLPADWKEVLDHPACVRCGDAWAKGTRTAILRVPSAIVPEEENVLINPEHADAERIAIEHIRSFVFDPRLLT